MFAWGIGAKTEGDAPCKVRIINCNSMAGKKGGGKCCRVSWPTELLRKSAHSLRAVQISRQLTEFIFVRPFRSEVVLCRQLKLQLKAT